MTKPKAPALSTNQVQRRYATDRVNQIAKLHSIAIKEDCDSKKRELPDRDEKCRMIREGKAILLPDRVRTNNRYNVPDIIEVHEFPAEVAILAHNEEVDKSYQQRVAALNTQARAISDQIMLGNDADEALRLITEFGESKF